jgi:hypothetical protein
MMERNKHGRRLNRSIIVMLAFTVLIAVQFAGFASAAKTQPAKYTGSIKVDDYQDVFTYLYSNANVILVAFLALMSYRFFTSKRMDFGEMWEEWKGRK